jgi:CBS domain-containing protein
MRCEDVMKRPVRLCHDYDTVQAAAHAMADANVGFIPVCDAHERLVGVLTDRDIAVRLAAEDRTASETRVGEMMTRGVVSCRPADEIEDAERLMAAHRTSRILVVSAGRALGVISLADLAALDGPGAAQTLRAIARRELLDARGARTRPAGG